MESLTPAQQAVYQQLSDQESQLLSQVTQMKMLLLEKENQILGRQMKAIAQGAGKSLPFWMPAGSVRDINTMIYPFFFATLRADVPASPGAPVTTGFTVNAEATFNMVEVTKAVYLKTTVPAFDLEYLNPDDPAGAGQAPGLSFTMQDSSSGRVFVDRTIALDHIGDPRFPTRFPVPQLIRPNARVQVTFDNSSANDYVAFLTFFGMRIRTDLLERLFETAQNQT